MNPKRLARLVYLSFKMRDKTPTIPKSLRRYLSNIEVIETARLGLVATASELDIPVERLRKLAKSGKKYGREVSPKEFRLLVAREIEGHSKLDDLPLNSKLKVLGILDLFVNLPDNSMVALEEVSLGEVKDIAEIDKWDSGFTPIDLVTGGLYKGVLVIMANPGGGKTSTIISIAEAIKRTHPKWSIIFFEEEIPQKLMLSRMRTVFERVTFTKRDVLVTGGTTIQEIMDRLKERDKKYPKERRVIIIDSPDTMPGLSGENRRFILGDIYRDLVRIKQHKQTELVIVASQPNRKKGAMTLTSLAESWEKAWLVDLVISVTKAGYRKLRMKVLKNRFGLPDQEVLYDYNFEDLTFDSAELEDAW